MSPEDLKILVISFYFPPYNRVGGRRWAKHCKYLVRSNIQTFVLTGNYVGSSSWDKDIETLNKNIFRIEHTINKKPFHQTKLPTNILEKIRWKISYYQWETKKNKIAGNFSDPSMNNEKKYLDKAIEIIKEKKINIVALSVGPFKYSSILIDLKKQFPDIKFVIDYRDYWEDSLFGLSKEQKYTELELQRSVIDHVDLILSPNQEMQKHYSEKFNVTSYLLPHCIDTDDLVNLAEYEPTKNMKLLYGGAFYSGIEDNIELIKKCINELSKKESVEANFYVSVKGYEEELKHPAIKRHDFIALSEYFDKVVQSDYVILILAENRINAMSSKFFELIALRKPIIYFGGSGEVSDFIIRHKLGFHITVENLEEQLKLIIENKRNKSIPDLNYDITEHTFDFQTKKLIMQLETICQNRK